MKNRTDCIFSDMCEEEFDCSEQLCNMSVKMNYLLEDSNLPRTFRQQNILYPEQCDMEAFMQLKQICDNATRFVNSGSSLYLYSSNSGNGKSTWASKIMLNYFSDICLQRSAFTVYGIFINVSQFLVETKRQINTPTNGFDTFTRNIEKARLVIFDDIGVAKSSAYDNTLLYSLINCREQEGLSNIYTSNVSPNDLNKILDNRLASRICRRSDDNYIIELKGGDNR